MSWKVTTEPVSLPISVSEAKSYLRISNSSEDALIEQIIDGAASYCEEELDLAIMEQTITLKLDAFPPDSEKEILLPRSNLLSVSSVGYTDTAGDPQTYADFTADTYSIPGRIVNNADEWPDTKEVANAVTIVYKAGFESYNTSATYQMPGAVSIAMLMLIAHFYENRGAIAHGQVSDEIAISVTNLLQKYRKMGL